MRPEWFSKPTSGAPEAEGGMRLHDDVTDEALGSGHGRNIQESEARHLRSVWKRIVVPEELIAGADAEHD